MSHRFSASFGVGAVIGGSLGLLACASAGRSEAANVAAAAVERQDEELGRIRGAVERALVAPPPGGYSAVPGGVRLLSVSRTDGGAIALDFSRELLAGGTGRVLEDAVHQILAAASRARPATANRIEDYRVLINGLPLESYLR